MVTEWSHWAFGWEHCLAMVRFVVRRGHGLIRELIGGLTVSSGESSSHSDDEVHSEHEAHFL
jgi:hypothetical protein